VTALAGAWLALIGTASPWPGPDVVGFRPRVAPVEPAHAADGRILGIIGRQAGWLNLEAPRPRVLTNVPSPAFVMDLDAVVASRLAVLAVVQSLPSSQAEPGGDLMALDLSGPGTLTPLVPRADASEWLGAPTWLPDGSGLLFQREDLRAAPDLYAGQAAVRYPSRVERATASGQDRAILIEHAFHPSPAPDGSEIAFLRTSPGGSSLLALDLSTRQERTLVRAGAQPDLAYPRYSPDSRQVAFLATSLSGRTELRFAPWLAPTAYAHGAPWDLWIVGRDGSGPRQLAAVGADDASLAWSPDGAAIFVYGSTGARLVDVASGQTTLLSYLAGFGAVAWLP
jgi:Tol biopolymer transport system component